MPYHIEPADLAIELFDVSPIAEGYASWRRGRRRELKDASFQFGAALRAAIACGKETTAGVLDHEFGPKARPQGERPMVPRARKTTAHRCTR